MSFSNPTPEELIQLRKKLIKTVAVGTSPYGVRQLEARDRTGAFRPLKQQNWTIECFPTFGKEQQLFIHTVQLSLCKLTNQEKVAFLPPEIRLYILSFLRGVDFIPKHMAELTSKK
eukprot:m.18044 g.18044  ORF g.18044 m.18044 type:complete len:116 (+) comp11612_c0_seq1:94-441(+)